MEVWRRIDTWDSSPAFNMGLDEALLEFGGAQPTLRFYTWQPDALSLGYFQRYADVPATSQATQVVRRITGGGAIHHVSELTFSIAAPLSHPAYTGPIAKSYERIHAALARALAELGISAQLRGDQPLRSDIRGTGMCFHHSTSLDLAWNTSKGVGSAQRRKAGRVLHHGSIKLDASTTEPHIATVAAAAEASADGTAPPGLATTPQAMADLVCAALEATLVIGTEPASPTQAERAHADRRGPFYTSTAFVHRR